MTRVDQLTHASGSYGAGLSDRPLPQRGSVALICDERYSSASGHPKRWSAGTCVLRFTAAAALFLLAATVTASAAPITGANQAEPAAAPAPALSDPSQQAPAEAPSETTVIGDPDATVIEFSVVPSAADPSKTETIIIVQQKGGNRICVNQSNTDILTRAYRPRGDDPFEPAVPSELRALTSGDVGELVGFNESRVFIRPQSEEDEFTNADECFRVAEFEACFVPSEEDCDQELQAGDFVCVADGISREGCPILDLRDLARQLRIILALNAPLGEAPIITAADIAASPDLPAVFGEPGAPGAGLPGGAPPAGPTFGPTFSGSGGGTEDLVTVPNVVGFNVSTAIDIMTNAGLVVGTVTVTTQVGSLDNIFIRSANAAIIECAPSPECIPEARSSGTTTNQSLTAGTQVPRNTVVNLLAVLQVSAAIPEPSSLAMFAMGLGLLILITWCQRRRLR